MQSKKLARWLYLVLVVAILFVVTGCKAEAPDQASQSTPMIRETTESTLDQTTPTPVCIETFESTISLKAEETLADTTPDENKSVSSNIEPSIPIPTPAFVTPTAAPTPTPQVVTPQPTPTQTPHKHNYSVQNIVVADCVTEGYTSYVCSCGHSYCDSYIPATDHDWSQWSITKEATTSSEGEQSRSCHLCGAVENQTIAQLPGETISTSELEAYGRNYGASLGFVPSGSLGLDGEVCGYFPPTSGSITDMDHGRQRVANKVYALYSSLLSMEGSDEAFRAVQCRINVVVTDNGNGNYTITVYYG